MSTTTNNVLTKDQYMAGLKPSNLRLYKLLGDRLINNGFVYKEGVNIDHVTFNPSGSCQPGGLYFFDEIQLIDWKKYFSINIPQSIGEVELLDDSKVYLEDGKQKADKFVLKNIKPWFGCNISNYINFENEEICKAAVHQDGHVLWWVPEKYRTEDLCKAAVQTYGPALEWVPQEYLTEELCKAAVQQDGKALEWVPDKYLTQELCKAAVQTYGPALEWVPVKYITQDLCKAAVQQNGMALEWVPDKYRTQDLCILAVQQDGSALWWVPEKLCHEVCKEDVQQCRIPFRYARGL